LLMCSILASGNIADQQSDETLRGPFLN
jgi:hypothetical protein